MKQKKFNVDDLVFAKVKGYPAWPAIITQVNKSTYSVRFYGTAEVGCCKPQDIFYYLKHRDKFIKNQKRKEYLDAVEEIELEIGERGGVDGSPLIADTSISNSESSFNSTPDNVRHKRRNSDKVTGQSKKRFSVAEEKNITIVEEPSITSEPTEETEKENERLQSDECVTLAEVKAQYKLPISLGRRPALTINDVKIITEDYLKAVVAYFEHIKEKPDLYKKNPMEYRNKSPNELVMVRTLTDEIVGIKYNRDEDIPSNSEYERALHEASEAKTMLKMKALLENGHCKPDEDLSLFETNLDITESQIEEAMELSLIESKKAKLQWLKIENRLAELDTEVKKQLGLDKANPSEAAKLLGEILKLDIEPLMLIKHPSVFDMARRLRRYVGNVSEWNYTEDECLKFDLLAERVRDTAGAVYTKFVELFKQTDEDNGYHQYLEQNNRFREQVTDMAECNVFALTAAPLSRVAFFDSMEDKEELKILVDKLGKNKMSSTVHLQV